MKDGTIPTRVGKANETNMRESCHLFPPFKPFGLPLVPVEHVRDMWGSKARFAQTHRVILKNSGTPETGVRLAKVNLYNTHFSFKKMGGGRDVENA